MRLVNISTLTVIGIHVLVSALIRILYLCTMKKVRCCKLCLAALCTDICHPWHQQRESRSYLAVSCYSCGYGCSLELPSSTMTDTGKVLKTWNADIMGIVGKWLHCQEDSLHRRTFLWNLVQGQVHTQKVIVPRSSYRTGLRSRTW